MKSIRIIFAAVLSATCLSLSAQEIKSQWNGARVAFLGDSITDAAQIGTKNDVYWNLMSDILGTIPYVYGINGHKMNQIIGQATKLENDHGQDVDAIVVFVGTNDYNDSLPLGEFFTYSDEQVEVDGHEIVTRRHREVVYDDATFCGRTNSVLRWLKSHYPKKQIILFTPLHRGYATFGDNNIQPDENYSNACGNFIDDYVNAIKRAGEIWSVPVIDLFSNSGLYPLLEEDDQFFRDKETDHLHPNTAGHTRLANVISYMLQSYPACLD